MIKRLSGKLNILLVLVFALSTFIATYYSSMDLHWIIKQAGNNKVNVYLNGLLAKKVAGVDLNISFDKKSLEISSINIGKFFSDSILIRSDNHNLHYSLMINPENKTVPDSSKPIFIFNFSPNNLMGYRFCILPSSQVYLSKIGGAFPKALCQNLK